MRETPTICEYCNKKVKNKKLQNSKIKMKEGF